MRSVPAPNRVFGCSDFAGNGLPFAIAGGGGRGGCIIPRAGEVLFGGSSGSMMHENGLFATHGVYLNYSCCRRL